MCSVLNPLGSEPAGFLPAPLQQGLGNVTGLAPSPSDLTLTSAPPTLPHFVGRGSAAPSAPAPSQKVPPDQRAAGTPPPPPPSSPWGRGPGNSQVCTAQSSGWETKAGGGAAARKGEGTENQGRDPAVEEKLLLTPLSPAWNQGATAQEEAEGEINSPRGRMWRRRELREKGKPSQFKRTNKKDGASRSSAEVQGAWQTRRCQAVPAPDLACAGCSLPWALP